MDEIEDTMPTRVKTGDEGRPGNGALRRDSRPEPAKAALPSERRQIRECIPMPFQKSRIHAVDSQHDETLGVDCVTSAARAENQ